MHISNWLIFELAVCHFLADAHQFAYLHIPNIYQNSHIDAYMRKYIVLAQFGASTWPALVGGHVSQVSHKTRVDCDNFSCPIIIACYWSDTARKAISLHQPTATIALHKAAGVALYNRYMILEIKGSHGPHFKLVSLRAS